MVLTREDPDAFPRDRIADLVLLSNLFGRATQTLVLSQAVKEAYDGGRLRTAVDRGHPEVAAARPRRRTCRGWTWRSTTRRRSGPAATTTTSSRCPNDRLGVLIADASGHGAPAAVLMAVAHSIAHTRPEPPAAAGRVPHAPERAT